MSKHARNPIDAISLTPTLEAMVEALRGVDPYNELAVFKALSESGWFSDRHIELLMDPAMEIARDRLATTLKRIGV